MFARGSRYRNLPQSAPVDARGERRIGADLRFIPDTPGQFLHSVSSSDRLDLLAFKYYGDSTRWWQIADANPEHPFPLDLLDRGPVVEEVLSLVATGNDRRFQQLLASVNAVADVRVSSNAFLSAEIVALFAATGARQQVIAAIGIHGFQLLRSFSWLVAGGSAEAFTLEDRALKTSWRAMLEELRLTPGVVELQSDLGAGTIDIVYNDLMLSRDGILSKLSQQGFAVSPLLSQRVERIGAKFTIPPNGEQ
jgi:hypothetical protein